ncbi:regulatory protein FleQ [Marinobacter sp. 3-2]|jgi:sigma-54 specific flagellar transcriptional regulator A|nr:regulatory protein FleQ [Marinobacter sp. 3-2]
MSKNNKVLVLSEDDSRLRDIVTILEFIGEEQVLAGEKPGHF